MMSIAEWTFLILGIFDVAAAVPQGYVVVHWGTNKEGGFRAKLPSGSIQQNWQNGERTQKSVSLMPGEAAITNTIVNAQSAVQTSKPTATNGNQNQVGAANINGSEKPQECYGLPSPGECRGAFPRFFYNSTLDQCDCFLYGGCGDEEIQSSWLTYEECFSTCGPGNTQEGPRCRLLPKQDIMTFTQPKPEILTTPDTSHLSDTDLINALFG